MTKSDLKTGMFGKFDNETDIFVIVADNIVYQQGLMDKVTRLNDELELPSGRKITALYDANCFGMVKRGLAKTIWIRGEEPNKKVEFDADEVLVKLAILAAVAKAIKKFEADK